MLHPTQCCQYLDTVGWQKSLDFSNVGSSWGVWRIMSWMMKILSILAKVFMSAFCGRVGSCPRRPKLLTVKMDTKCNPHLFWDVPKVLQISSLWTRVAETSDMLWSEILESRALQSERIRTWVEAWKWRKQLSQWTSIGRVTSWSRHMDIIQKTTSDLASSGSIQIYHWENATNSPDLYNWTLE